MSSNKDVQYVDLQLINAKEFWEQIVKPNVEDYLASPSIRLGMSAAWSLWHLHEWEWHDLNPGQNTKDNSDYVKFCKDHLTDCPALGRLRDLADASKHRGLSRKTVTVTEVANLSGKGGMGGYDVPAGGYGVGALAYGSNIPEPRMLLKDDGCIWLSEAVEQASSYWQKRFA